MADKTPQFHHPTGNAAAAVLSNLAKAAEKQQRMEESERYSALAQNMWKAPENRGTLSGLKDAIETDLAERYPAVHSLAEEKRDRGVLRALTWGQKVSSIQRSLVDRFLGKGVAMLAGKNIFVCEACGFISVGNEAPEICPVCKAPGKRFTHIK
jgi:rubrerythrin